MKYQQDDIKKFYRQVGGECTRIKQQLDPMKQNNFELKYKDRKNIKERPNG